MKILIILVLLLGYGSHAAEFERYEKIAPDWKVTFYDGHTHHIFNLHSEVLKKSSYFNAVIGQNYQESETKELTFSGDSLDSFKKIRDFLYQNVNLF